MQLKRRLEKLERGREEPEEKNRGREFWEELWDRMEAHAETGKPFDFRELIEKYGLDWPEE